MEQSTKATRELKPSDLNFTDPAVLDDPFEFYDVVRENEPIYKIPELGVYIVTRYDDLREILMDTETFSNDHMGWGLLQGENWKLHEAIIEERGWPDVPTLNQADPPAHTRYRRIGEKIFNPRRIVGLVPRIEEICGEVIDAFIDDGQCEFVSAFSFPFVGSVISEQLGLDGAKRETFKSWGSAIMEPSSRVMTRDELRRNAETILEMQHFMAEMFDKRRAEPRNDLISALVEVHDDDGNGLTTQELHSLMRQFLSGTYESVTTMISHSMWMLLRFPDQMKKLRANRELMSGFIEEALRFDSPVPGLGRYVMKDTEVGGVKLPAGAILMVRYAAANRDPEKFPSPETFDIERKEKDHLAFGSGPHICIGRQLARREMAIAFNALLDRMEDIALAKPLPSPAHHPHAFLRPMKELHITFRKVA